MPLTSLATMKCNPGDAEIERENLQSMGMVSGRLENRDLGSTMKEIQQVVSSNSAAPGLPY
jgi:Cu/Ag efflux pump CusA